MSQPYPGTERVPEREQVAARRDASSVCAYIGLGSNLADPENQLRRALGALDKIPHSRLIAASALYRSDPVGPQDQPNYINAVAGMETGLSPWALLAALQAIERAHGRVRGPVRWGPRTLDLDLLLFGKQRLDTPVLTVPHPFLHQRAFVLYPLAEIAPDLEIPGQGWLRDLLLGCPRAGLSRLPGFFHRDTMGEKR